MARNQIMFYATALDLNPVLSALELASPLQYTAMGMFRQPPPRTYLSYIDIPDFGRAVHPTAAANPSYIMAVKGTKIHMREIPQKEGGCLWGVDQMLNDDTVVFRPGGRYRNDVILCGMVGTISTTSTSKNLYSAVVKGFRKNLIKEREFFVGAEANEVWNAGVRLTIGAFSPPEFDLKHKSV